MQRCGKVYDFRVKKAIFKALCLGEIYLVKSCISPPPKKRFSKTEIQNYLNCGCHINMYIKQ